MIADGNDMVAARMDARASDAGALRAAPPSRAGSRRRCRRIALVAFVVAGIVLLITGHNLLTTYRQLFDAAFLMGSPNRR
jgi:ferric-dicitrate binding protein FerR (iron transport regulator)